MSENKWLYKYLDLLRENHQFLSTHDRIKNFSQTNSLPYMCDIGKVKLTKKTQNNLKLVSKLLDINWLYCIPYFATSSTNRKGYFIYGLLSNGELINYHRQEVNSSSSGQTVMHIDNYTLQITKLLRINKQLNNRDIKALIKLEEIDHNYTIQNMLFRYHF